MWEWLRVFLGLTAILLLGFTIMGLAVIIGHFLGLFVGVGFLIIMVAAFWATAHVMGGRG